MSQYTKEERHQIYKDALYKYINRDFRYMCACIDDDVYIRHLPEFISQKPKEQYSACIWFPLEDRQSRIAVLEKCIELTKPE